MERTTRRAALAAGGAGVGALAAAMAVRAAGGAAEGGSPVPGTGLDAVPAVIRAWVDAWNAGDPVALAALYAPEGVLEDVPNGAVARGPEILASLQRAAPGLAGVSLHVAAAFAAGGFAAVEYEFRATNVDLVPLPGAVGLRFASRRVTLFELTPGGDLIRRSSDYYDVASLLAQLGVTLAPAGPGPEPSTPTPAPGEGGGVPTVGPPKGSIPPPPLETPTS